MEVRSNLAKQMFLAILAGLQLSTNCVPDCFGAIVAKNLWRGLIKHLFHTFKSMEQRFRALRNSGSNLCEPVRTGSTKSAIL
ncbi:hypothetical protein B0H10DRAFT_2119552 [Mycena sp. CBHHK59/15]|nr:hypothetical protein B0H10DRAFT_2119552 [Mycena sp. CBHHK59/15]